MQRKSFVLPVLGAVIFFLASVSSADVPDSINYQGKLTTATGGCVNDTVQMTFSIYPDTLPGTTADWTETQMQVVVKDGIFNVLLGSVTPLPASLFDGNAKYLSVQVESDPEMRPLKPMVSVAYAFRSEFSDTAEYARAAPAMPDDDWAISGDDIYRLTGNVGIGTTSPGTYKLNVNGTGYFGAQLNIMDPDYYLQLSGNDARIIFDSGSDWFRFDRTSNAYDFIIAADKVFSAKSASQYLRGNVGIGTLSPTQKLDVAGTAQMAGFKMTTDAADGYVLTSDASGVGTWQAVGGGNWSVTDSVLYTNNYWGIARGGVGNVLYGDSAHTMVNLGVTCTTGTSGQNYSYSTVSGGHKNVASYNYSTVGGGSGNTASHTYSTVGGGYSNTASGYRSTIAGGLSNTASGGSGTVGGGESNTATYYSTVGGGISNTAGNDYSTVSGGGYNDASGDNSTVGGGYSNTATGISSTIDGGANNTASGGGSTVGGGWGNTASGHYSTVGGGCSDTSKALYGGVFSGYSNLAGDALEDTSAFVGGGWDNSATAKYATVGGGHLNTASGDHSTVGGGRENSTAGDYSVILGGREDTLTSSAAYSMAFGNEVYVSAGYRVVFFDASHAGRLGINRDGHDGWIDYPIHVGTNTGNGNGAYLSASGWWTSTSSRNFKENFEPLDGQELLAKISNLAVDSWEFKDSDERHIGPYAEDFVEAFDVGTIREDGTRDNQYLAAGDVAGVALAGVKELAQQNQELRQIIEQLRQSNTLLEARVAELEKAK